MKSRLIVGIGSPHGDDRAGWAVIERLQSLQAKNIVLRKAAVPHDLIDWLDDTDALHIVDCCLNESEEWEPHRFALQQTHAIGDSQLHWRLSQETHLGAVTTLERPPKLRSAGSHQIDVLTVLEIAACLNRLPGTVVLWAIPSQRFAAGETISWTCEQAIQRCVDKLSKELGNA